MEEKILKTILDYKLIKKGDRVGVGFSGGMDSVALVCALYKLQKQLGFELVAIHVNHNLRGEEAVRDQEFAKNFCERMSIQCVVKSVDVNADAKENKYTIEQSARNLRYNAFNEVAKDCALDVIALAHHKNDQAETVLMHIGRGCGINGLIGMRYRSGKLIRPMLDIERSEVEDYISRNSLQFVEDSTNNCIDYKRNYVRHNLLKDLEKAYPGVVDNLVKLSKHASIDEDFIQSVLPKHLIQKRVDGVVLLNEAANMHSAVISRLIRECFSILCTAVDVENLHIESCIELFSNAVGKRLDMPNGVIIVRCYEGVLFKKKESEECVEIPFSLSKFNFFGQDFEVREIGEMKDLPKGNGVLFFDLDKLQNQGAVWRTFTSEDRFTKFGGGTKKLKDYLVSKKVDSEMRKILPCLMKGNECLLIAGVEISESIKIDKNTKRIGMIGKL